MKEHDIESYLMKQSKKNGFLCWKFISPSINGVPDRILIGHGLIIFVETKAPGKTPRKRQIRTIEKMEAHGAIVKVIDTKEKIDAFFRDIMKITGKSKDSIE